MKPKIATRGHVEKIGSPPVMIACKNCTHMRLKNRDWIEPCPAANEAKGQVAASAG